MPLDVCMAHHTHRQMRAWIRWLERRKPTRSDYYAMQIAKFLARIFALFTGGEYSPDLDAYRIQPDRERASISPQDRVANSKAAALAATGAKR